MSTEQCSMHPDRRALSFCHSCGKHFCEECLIEGAEYYYCQAQACQQSYKGELDSEPEKAAALSPSPNIGHEMARFSKVYWIFFWLTQAVSIAGALAVSADFLTLVSGAIAAGIGWAFTRILLAGLLRFSTGWFVACLVLHGLAAALALLFVSWGAWPFIFALAWPMYVVWFLLLRSKTRNEFRRLRLKRSEALYG